MPFYYFDLLIDGQPNNQGSMILEDFAVASDRADALESELRVLKPELRSENCFVRVVDERTLAFPNYDGNGTFLSMGNVLRNPQVGLLFIDFTSPKRLRVNGVASLSADDPLLAAYPEAQFVVRVAVTHVLPNCPRYVHRMETVEHSRFVPRAECETPVPDWKRRPWSHDVLPAGDPALTMDGLD